jgi:hypothetical protein
LFCFISQAAESGKEFQMKKLVQNFEAKTGSKTKQKKLQVTEDNFEVDLKDSRFGELFSSSDFALDPTHPKYPSFLSFLPSVCLLPSNAFSSFFFSFALVQDLRRRKPPQR